MLFQFRFCPLLRVWVLPGYVLLRAERLLKKTPGFKIRNAVTLAKLCDDESICPWMKWSGPVSYGMIHKNPGVYYVQR